MGNALWMVAMLGEGHLIHLKLKNKGIFSRHDREWALPNQNVFPKFIELPKIRLKMTILILHVASCFLSMIPVTIVDYDPASVVTYKYISKKIGIE